MLKLQPVNIEETFQMVFPLHVGGRQETEVTERPQRELSLLIDYF